MSIIWIILGLIGLVVGGEYLVRSSVALSFKLSISKMVIGMTVVSFATSAPELLVSLNAALTGSPAIAINNVIGSNIANIGLVLGITALVGSIAVDRSFYTVNWPVKSLCDHFYRFHEADVAKLAGVPLSNVNITDLTCAEGIYHFFWAILFFIKPLTKCMIF